MQVPTVAGLVVLIAFVPAALAWYRVSRRRVPSRDQTFLDLAGVYFVGVVSSLASATIVVALFAPLFPDAFPDFQAVARTNDLRRYATENVSEIVVAVLVWILVSIGIAYVAARFAYRGRPASLSPHLTVWFHVLGQARGKRQALLAVHLHDGTIVEGALDTYPIDSSDDLAISIKPPIHLRVAGSDERFFMDHLDRLIVQGDRISHIGVIYLSAPGS